MQKREKKTIPERVEDEVVAYICDLCGKESRRGGCWVKDPNVNEPTVQIEQGYVYPEDSQVRIRRYHLCPECFETRLEPWLKEQGATPTEDSFGDE